MWERRPAGRRRSSLLEDLRGARVGSKKKPHTEILRMGHPTVPGHSLSDERATLYDDVGSVKRHLKLTSYLGLVFFLLKRSFSFLSTKARS